jgi:hypothetical protein
MIFIKTLALDFGIVTGVGVLCWRGWNAAMYSLSLRTHMIRLLNITYGILLLSCVLGAIITASLWTNELGSVAEIMAASRVVYFVSILLIIQVAGFGFVCTPVLFRWKGKRYSFVQCLLGIECCLVPTTAIILIYYLSMLNHYVILMLGNG